jgi:hypothetical protein
MRGISRVAERLLAFEEEIHGISHIMRYSFTINDNGTP